MTLKSKGRTPADRQLLWDLQQAWSNICKVNTNLMSKCSATAKALLLVASQDENETAVQCLTGF